MKTDAGLLKWLEDIDTFGIGLVQGIEPDTAQTTRLAERIAPIRETHYGRLWEFTSDLAHCDTAYTSMALGAHTDTTYFSDPVGLQLFHVLEHTETGGKSLYVDGFNAALQLKEQKPWAFDALTRLHVRAQCTGDDNTFLQSDPFPIIRLDENGQLAQIRFNNDDRQVLDLDASSVKLFYAALGEWTRLVRAPFNQLWIQLEPNQAVLVDNRRVLHGRSEFTGLRRVCGCYHHWDDYCSRLKTLRTRQAKN